MIGHRIQCGSSRFDHRKLQRQTRKPDLKGAKSTWVDVVEIGRGVSSVRLMSDTWDENTHNTKLGSGVGDLTNGKPGVEVCLFIPRFR
jgi:hypothetical protein